MKETIIFIVRTNRGDSVGQRYCEKQAELLARTCDRTRPQNAPHRITHYSEFSGDVVYQSDARMEDG